MVTPQIATSLMTSPTAEAWQKIGIKSHHGINIPLFSLHTEKSGGIGEFLDLIPVMDWCKKIGFNTIQILPINDTGPEPSPYSAISAFALNPLHISLASLPDLRKYNDLLELLKDLKTLTQQRLDYPALHKKRDEFLHLYYQYIYPTESQKEEYLTFIKINPWLEVYALFKTLKIIRQWQPWELWPQELKDPSPSDLDNLYNEYKTQTSYHIFLQYLCFQQFNQVKKEAKNKGIFLKGDIPILTSKESADVWFSRNLFNLEFTAGAPPDMFSCWGQNWEFPIYNWTEIEKQHYAWWKQRLNLAADLYDLFRIDHIVGFFRIWAIPLHKQGKDGKFIPEDQSQWINLGTKNLTAMLQDCPILPIGEDLGVVPPEVRQCLRKLGISGTKVIRWERNWNTDKSFIPVSNYIPESMTTVSTHDSETLQLWWKNNPQDAQDYSRYKGWDYSPTLQSSQQYDILKDSHHSGSLFHINLLNEYLSLIPNMTWPNLEDERINDPALQSNKNWTYRFRPSWEEIAKSQEVENLMKSLIA